MNGFPENNFILKRDQIPRVKFGAFSKVDLEAFSKVDLINTYIDLAEDNDVDYNEHWIWSIRKRRQIISMLRRDFSTTDLFIALNNNRGDMKE